MQKTVSIKFTKQELWELLNNFGASFESQEKGNEVCDRVSCRLSKAFNEAFCKHKPKVQP